SDGGGDQITAEDPGKARRDQEMNSHERRERGDSSRGNSSSNGMRRGTEAQGPFYEILGRTPERAARPYQRSQPLLQISVFPAFEQHSLQPHSPHGTHGPRHNALSLTDPAWWHASLHYVVMRSCP